MIFFCFHWLDAWCVCLTIAIFFFFSFCDPSFAECSGWFNSIAGVVKRRFASYVKLHITPGDNKDNKDRERYEKQGIASGCSQMPVSMIQSPSPHVLTGIDRRHRSPDPPPR